MNGRGKTDQTTRAVPRLVVLLFSLALIAEWAATASAPVRYAVMLILRRAEAIAYSIVYWEIHDQGLTLQWALPHGCRTYSDPQAAMMLGWWFRILAVALRDLPRRAFFAKLRRLTSPSPNLRGNGGLAARRSLPLAGVRRTVGQGPTGWGNLRPRGPPCLLS